MKIKKLIEAHKFFVRTSRSFIGVKKEDKSKPYPIWGENYWWRRFDPNEGEMYKYTIVDVGYRTTYVYRLKDLLFWPIAYLRFMYYSIK